MRPIFFCLGGVNLVRARNAQEATALPTRMPTDNRYSLRSLLTAASFARLAIIGAILVLVVVAFVWAGGWFSTGHLDQAQIVRAFEADFGVHSGFRRNHAKGVCLSGWFDGNGAGTSLSRAGVFKPGRIAVFGRFSLPGGMPMVADSPQTAHALALDFALPDGEAWRTAMVDIPVFPVKAIRAFYDQLVASVPDPKTAKPDPAKMKAFVASHPDTARALGIIKAHPMASGFADATYNSLNAFRFVNASGVSTPVRWSFVPVDTFHPVPSQAPADKNYLFDELADRLDRSAVQWHLIVIVGRPGDPTNDATQPWPQDRQRVDVGTLTVTRLEAERPGNCRDINFDPLVLPSGIAPSDDPLLSARSAVYSRDFTKRVSERHTPSAVQTNAGH